MECFLEEWSCHCTTKNCRYFSVARRVLKKMFLSCTHFKSFLTIFRSFGCFEWNTISDMIGNMSIWSLPVGVFAFLGKLIQLNNWSFPLFGFSQLVELRVNNVCICTREEHLPPCCFPALRSSSCSSVRWHCCITTGNLAPKTGPKKGWVGNKVSKWSGNISEEIFGLKDSLCVKN